VQVPPPASPLNRLRPYRRQSRRLGTGTRFALTSLRSRFRPRPVEEKSVMSLLKWALVFLVMAGLAAVFGFTNIAEGAAEIAKILFFIVLAIVIVLVILGMTVYRSVT
ncbi:MAG TPA: DUF1328 domain-containing protein, partial [Gemmataceae bacterium]|nr:DUF1328 domain-containing protein [Gemmataceae bacterium]